MNRRSFLSSLALIGGSRTIRQSGPTECSTPSLLSQPLPTHSPVTILNTNAQSWTLSTFDAHGFTLDWSCGPQPKTGELVRGPDGVLYFIGETSSLP